MSTLSQTIPTQGLHHITLTGAGRKITLDFWEGVLGMPFVFEQPNLDKPDESHLYFDPGDDRLITVFCDEKRSALQGKIPIVPGAVHHLAFSVSQAVSIHLPQKLDELGIAHSGLKDRYIKRNIINNIFYFFSYLLFNLIVTHSKTYQNIISDPVLYIKKS